MFALLVVRYRVVTKRLFYVFYNLYLNHHTKFKADAHTR
jgi:hypothetical protein